ncbi:hypothetical protein Syun_009498 [Stephania yunnanensis]|uniref:Uncharacterized protein n=1 Tax=Stephania yunnanensis TaxID=152371 RepID=A0AAP0KGI1_9MAGN
MKKTKMKKRVSKLTNEKDDNDDEDDGDGNGEDDDIKVVTVVMTVRNNGGEKDGGNVKVIKMRMILI